MGALLMITLLMIATDGPVTPTELGLDNQNETVAEHSKESPSAWTGGPDTNMWTGGRQQTNNASTQQPALEK